MARILRRHDLKAMTGLSDSTIERLERRGEFPQRRRLGPASVGWLVEEIERWIETRPIVGGERARR